MKRISRQLAILLCLCMICTACGIKGDTEATSTEASVAETEDTADDRTAEVPAAEVAATEVAATEETAVDTQVIEPGNIHQVVIATDEIIQPIEMGKTMLADLDGDGEPEMITVRKSLDDRGNYVNKLYFQVNELYYHGNDFGKLIPSVYLYSGSFYLVDLDTSDRYKEILILDPGDVENKGHFLRYDQGEMIPISGNNINGIELSGERVSICGDGTVITNDRDYSAFEYNRIARTWKLTDSNRFHTILEEVTECYDYTLYSPGDWLTLNQEMTFYAQMDGSMDQLLTLPAGTKVNIARFYPDSGWMQFLYDGNTKEAWMKLIGGRVLLPMNIYESSIEDYISGFSNVG